MRAHKRILNIRKQSRIDLPKQNLWYYSENEAILSSLISEKKTSRNDRISILNDDYTRYSHGNTELPRSKKECPFVVDWQLEGNF
jgi:hypothetical protein